VNHDEEIASLAARLRKANIDPDALAALVWSIRPARLLTADDIEALAERVTEKFGSLLKQMVRQAVVDQARENRREVLDELRGLVRLELEQLIAELGSATRRAQTNGQAAPNGRPQTTEKPK